MTSTRNIYCLDANFFIEGWNKYYSPLLSPTYWDVINRIAEEGTIFIPKEVQKEIINQQDELAKWIKVSPIQVKSYTENVGKCLKSIYAQNPLHYNLVDNTKNRSAADPWVIAHAINENAIVVTKEYKITNPATTKIKIPNVCENMGIEWIDDFEFARRMNIKFHCSIEK